MVSIVSYCCLWQNGKYYLYKSEMVLLKSTLKEVAIKKLLKLLIRFEYSKNSYWKLEEVQYNRVSAKSGHPSKFVGRIKTKLVQDVVAYSSVTLSELQTSVDDVGISVKGMILFISKETTTNTGTIITLLDRANFQLQNTILPT